VYDYLMAEKVPDLIESSGEEDTEKVCARLN